MVILVETSLIGVFISAHVLNSEFLFANTCIELEVRGSCVLNLILSCFIKDGRLSLDYQLN